MMIFMLIIRIMTHCIYRRPNMYEMIIGIGWLTFIFVMLLSLIDDIRHYFRAKRVEELIRGGDKNLEKLNKLMREFK